MKESGLFCRPLQLLVLTVRFTVGVNIDDASNLSRISGERVWPRLKGRVAQLQFQDGV